jgi:hypothetical protein
VVHTGRRKREGNTVKSIGWLVLLISLVSCTDFGERSGDESGWALFRLADSSLTDYELRSVPLEKIALLKRPLITAADLTAYSWSTHSFTGTGRLDSTISTLSLLHGHSRGLPFMVAVDGQPVYLGSFWFGYSSIADSGCPYVMLPPVPPYRIQASLLGEIPDPRGDNRVFEALSRAGILRP